VISSKAFHRFIQQLLILIALAFLPTLMFAQIEKSPDDRPQASQASDGTSPSQGPAQAQQGSTQLIGGYVVRHHAAGDGASAFFITPLVDQSTRTYGLQVEFTPAVVSRSKVGKFIGRLQAAR
jgi:hypothetical protein